MASRWSCRARRSPSAISPIFGKGRDQLLGRLAANESVLLDACTLLSAAISQSDRDYPGGRMAARQLLSDRRTDPHRAAAFAEGYSWELPRLASGPSAGFPRVYDIALESISHGDGRVDQDSLARFVAAYQKITPLTLGELWAIPIMLRLALIENLRRVAARVAADRSIAIWPTDWADRMIAVAEQRSQEPDPGRRRHGALRTADGERRSWPK